MVYEMLGLGELQPTPNTLQLADRSIKRPRGILEDVLVKVGKFYFTCRFYCLGYGRRPDAITFTYYLRKTLYENC